MRSLILTSLSLIALAVVGCGKGEKDPLKNYEELNDPVPFKNSNNPGSDTAMLTLFDIVSESDLIFVEGERKSYAFSTRLFFDQPEAVKYVLSKVDGPKDGATFEAQPDGTYVLSWAPRVGTIPRSEDIGTMNLVLSFSLRNDSSPLSKAQFGGHYDRKEFKVSIVRNREQPVIEESITTSPGLELNPDQQTTISFVVSATGAISKDDLRIDMEEGPARPTRELVQANGKWGVLSVKGPTQIESKEGRKRFKYEVVFNARPFVDMLYQTVHLGSDEVLKQRFQRGEIPQAEAAFTISAVNEYNRQPSAKRSIILLVNLNDKAGAAKLVGRNNAVLAVGREFNGQFDIRSSGNRGEVKVLGVSLDETPLTGTRGKYSLPLENILGDITCTRVAGDLLKDYGCERMSCVQTCAVTVKTTCQSAEKTFVLKIATESQLGAEKVEKILEYPVQVKGRLILCPPLETPVAEGDKP